MALRMVPPRYSPSSGELRTILIVWSVDDERRKGDARYWWTEDDVARLRRLDRDIRLLLAHPRDSPWPHCCKRRKAGTYDCRICGTLPELLTIAGQRLAACISLKRLLVMCAALCVSFG